MNVFVNELLVGEPLYNLYREDGTLIVENATLELANEIQRQGTVHSAPVMNNFFDFDNPLSVRNANYLYVETNNGNTMTETFRHRVGNVLLADRVSTFTGTFPTETINMTERLYLNGVVVQTRTGNFSFLANGNITGVTT